MTDESSDVPRELMGKIRAHAGPLPPLSVSVLPPVSPGEEVLTSCRAFLLSARIPTKLELTFSYLEIHGVICHKPSQMAVETEKCNISMKMASPEDVSDVLGHIGTCLRKIFPGLSPLSLPCVPDPCPSFSESHDMYACVCDWLGFSYREEVQWDVDTIYLTQDTRELNLQDFSHLDHRDLIPIIAALEYNQWFTKLSSKDLKLSTDVCEQILRVVSRSNRLEELVLENAGLRANLRMFLKILIIAVFFWFLGVSSLSIQFAKLPKGLKHLNLSKTSFCSCGGMCDRALLAPQVCGALLRGCLQCLAVLNLSRTVFSHRKVKEVPPSFKQFFSSSLALMHVNLSGTKLSPEPLKALLLGLSCNHSLKGVSLDLSSCELRSGGAQVLESCIAEIHNISSLDISDNGLESDLSTLIVWLSKNRSIHHLALGKNFNNMKSKNLAPVLDNLVQMIQDEDSPLQSLSLADSKLKADVTIIINALGSNTSLTKVDISGNGMGDMGAKMLAKALQINTKLRTVIWDKNNITAQGFQDIAVAMEKNYTLRFMPIPMYDASQALKTNPEKTEEALQKIENYLLRNHETRKYLQEQAYRLQQGIVSSTTQQMIDRICVKVQDHLNSLRSCGGEAVQEDLKSAEQLMRDAKNSKTLLPNLYHVGGASSGLLSSPIQETLESMAGEVTRVVDEQLKGLLESMVDAAESLCPNVMKKAHIRQDLLHASAEKVSVPRAFVRNVLLEQSGIDILNKISEVKLTLASFLSDRIVDEILDALSCCHHKLADHFSRQGKSLPQQESLEIELAAEKVAKRAQPAVAEELTEVERLEDLDTCMVRCVRWSWHAHSLSPLSSLPFISEMEFDLDKALEEVPIHVEDPPFPLLAGQERRSTGLSGPICELPSEEGRKLEHFTKLRPKRNKKQQPTQAAICVASIAPHDGDQNGLTGRVDEGVDEFFTKKVTKMDSKRSTRGSDSQELGEGGGDEKKKRDSRKSGFLNLIKSRSRAERPPTALMTEEPSSPKGAFGSPAAGTPRRAIQPAEHNGAADRPEEIKTPEPPEEGPGDEAARPERSPQGGRRYMQMMGSGLLAEMRAKQERRAACAHKKLGNDIASQDSASMPSSSTERLDGENRLALGSPEKNPKVDVGYRPRSSSSTPTSPKPLLQSPKPTLAARPCIPQKPRTASRPEDAPDSPSGPSSPKVALLPPALRKLPADKERNGQSSPQPAPRSFPQEVSRKSWGQQAQEIPEPKHRSSSKDGRHGSKASDSGEEAEKEFIFV
uniref:Capping protein regulator and myosin 1 linker 1 n=1 Tax=Jaculus jaculus TaxID=51337 RepID=A0A8C5JXK9_JACJA